MAGDDLNTTMQNKTSARSLKLKIAAPLDPGFQPAVLVNRSYVAAAKASGRRENRSSKAFVKVFNFG